MGHNAFGYPENEAPRPKVARLHGGSASSAGSETVNFFTGSSNKGMTKKANGNTMRQFFDRLTRQPMGNESQSLQIVTQLQYVICIFRRFKLFGTVIAVDGIRTIMTTILTIDDDAHILALYRGILEREGYGIIESADGDRGIEICREEPVDLVITDIIMPGKEGLETIMELRQEFPDLGIVAVSGGGWLGPDSYLPLAIKMGAQRTLSKPFARQELLDTVEDLLGNARLIGAPMS